MNQLSPPKLDPVGSVLCVFGDGGFLRWIIYYHHTDDWWSAGNNGREIADSQSFSGRKWQWEMFAQIQRLFQKEVAHFWSLDDVSVARQDIDANVAGRHKSTSPCLCAVM